MSQIDWEKLLKSNVEVMSKAFKTDGNDIRVLGAFVCAAYGRVADPKKLEESKSILKDKFNALSEFRGNLFVPLIVKMSLSENPTEYLQRVLDIYEELSSDYKFGNEMRILAAIILCDNTDVENQKEMLSRTIEVYNKMKAEHSVLSGQEDIPFAALIAISNGVIDTMLNRAEDCYKLLKESFKLSKKDILNVSRILSLNDGTADELSDAFLKIYNALKDNKLAIKGTQMMILSVLAKMNPDTDELLPQIKDNEQMLTNIKGFHGALGLSSMNRRMYAAAITALNNSQGEMSVEGTVMSSVMSVIISIEMVAIMLMYIPVIS